MNRDLSEDRTVPSRLDFKVSLAVSPHLEFNLHDALTIEVLEPSRSGVRHIGDITDFFIPVSPVLGDLRKTAVHPFPGTETAGIQSLIFTEQIASQVSGIFPASHKRSSIRTTRSHFRLSNRAVFPNSNRLDAALSAKCRTIRVTVVKNVPLSANLLDTAVVISAIIHRLIGRLIGIDVQIIITDDNALVNEVLGRRMTCSITQLMHRN
ncbi:hypothetical protein D3C76_1253500 [compost metagenome]